jgi:TatD DNase family protein
MNTFSYAFGDNLYLNITNRCMMACPYCIKNKWSYKFADNDLKLEREPSSQEAITSMGDIKEYNEIIFCGYGDPLIRLIEVEEISKWVKENDGKVRINTAGLANKYYGKDVLPQLQGLADIISISLNGSNPKEYNEINRPMFKEESFDEVIKFAKSAKNYIPQVVITAVEELGFDVLKVKEIAKSIGVQFRLRPYLNN